MTKKDEEQLKELFKRTSRKIEKLERTASRIIRRLAKSRLLADDPPDELTLTYNGDGTFTSNYKSVGADNGNSILITVLPDSDTTPSCVMNFHDASTPPNPIPNPFNKKDTPYYVVTGTKTARLNGKTYHDYYYKALTVELTPAGFKRLNGSCPEIIIEDE